ncbi:hypothetical protein [Fusobacterium sp.]|uniref:hypothetical protein n=1 Tax=Fusobacterium sp. TaxID=68766 RepID=UPI00261BBAFC|nr:hypothetical protein [Fusobacterium sp.]
MIENTEKIVIDLNIVSERFFNEHREVYDKFIDNIKRYYYNDSENIDIKAIKNYKNLYRMKIENCIVIYLLIEDEIRVINAII